MKIILSLLLASYSVAGFAAESKTATTNDKGKTYALIYKLKAGETILSKVVHRSAIKTTVKNTTQTSKSVAVSQKNWRVYDVLDNGKMKFIHRVDHVKMWQQVTGSAEVRYDSTKDKNPPEGYRDVAKTIGIPLSDITIDRWGKVTARVRKTPRQKADVSGGQVTLPLPRKPVVIGATWNHTYQISVLLKGARPKQIKARQLFKLLSVEKGVAKISITTQILTPGITPRIKVQLIQRISNGHALFDINLGRVVYQKMVVEGTVQQFRGPESIMKCNIIFEETLLPKPAKIAVKPSPKSSASKPSQEKPKFVGQKPKAGGTKFKR